jgi:CDP-glycerol glycerophosphotransferase
LKPVQYLRKGAALSRRLIRAARFEVYAFWRRQPIRQNTVLYESFAGNGMLCNPEAIFRALLADDKFSNFTHTWVLRNKHENPKTIAEFAADRRVQFVRPATSAYYRALATSRYLVNNATFPPDFGKREGQIYLNTWHGTPLKRMGYDIGDPASRVGNVIRNFLAADYLLAANHFMIDQMYEKAHLLKNIYRGTFIETGYPRIDHQFLDASARQHARDELERTGLTLDGRKIIVYAPTWKGTNFNRPQDDITELVNRVTELQAQVDSSVYVVLLKTHQVVHKFASTLPALAGRLISNEIPTNTVLGLTDVLVTDYSSIFFDFLATGRPIMFLTPDIADYTGYRGLYMQPETWPGAVVGSVGELATEINALTAGPVDGRSEKIMANYRAMQQRFTPHDDGGATQRVVDVVFRGIQHPEIVSAAARDGRPTILINAGSLRPNGITTSLLNLLDAIDYTRFDVSVVFPNSRRPVILANQALINSGVRQFARVGGMNGSKLSQLSRRRSWMRGDLRNHQTDPVQKRMWDDEWARCFGLSTFDYVVDFSGYGPFWATLMLHAPGAEHSIWLHNDLAADAQRMTLKRQHQLRDLQGIFSLYREYDHLVSVSPALAEINARNLSQYSPAEHFDSTVNVINAPRIIEQAAVSLSEATADSATGATPAWVSKLGSGAATFITVGRLSPEKNHARLVRAFALVHAEQPNTQLFIVGDGPLRATLERLIAQLGLGDAVWLTGHQQNPHAIMAAADCFVLSSDYEGQPMVLLEALVLGLPIVTVDFGSARDALPQGSGLVVPSTDEGLADGLREHLAGRVNAPAFDIANYLARATEGFYAAIGASA